MNPICPKCNTAIADGDFDVSTDVAHCHRCEKDYSFSALLAIESENSLAYEEFHRKHCSEDARGKKLVIAFIKAPLFFAVPFFCLFSYLTMWGIFIEPLTRGETEEITMCYRLPFVITSLAHIAFLAFIYILAFGKWAIKINYHSLIITTGVFPFHTRQEVNFDQITEIAFRYSEVRINGKPVKHFAIKNTAQSIKHGALIPVLLKPLVSRWLQEDPSQSITFGACIPKRFKPCVSRWLLENIKPN